MSRKKIFISVLLIIAIAIQIGCTGNENQEDINNDENGQQDTTDNSTNDNDTKKENGIINELNTLVEEDTELIEIIEFIDENISTISKENASIMISKLEEVQKQNLSRLDEKFYGSNTIQSEINDIYNPKFNINEIDNVDDEDLKELLIETRDTGYKIETAEGMYFPIINYEFYKQYSSYVTSDIKEYIDIMAIESNEVPAKDAALVIGWDEVLERALKQEKFINQYSESAKINNVKELYKKYVAFTLFGLNNTPLINYDSKVIVDDAKNIYMNAIESDVDSKLLETLRDFLEILKEDKYKLTDESDQFRKDALENIL